ncbi:MAG TPA: DUF3795 domain-containing protein [Candidatus Ozemobacteraceae bacterium]|nr:DUF3795 domain-containing protein [Candidatus Ozemobacteraceae bacterium]
MTLSACGVKCRLCPHHQKQCSGCAQVKGSPWWAVEHVPGKVCPIYACAVNTKKLAHCGDCARLPCQTFTELRDPSMSDQEYQEQLNLRLERLRSAK